MERAQAGTVVVTYTVSGSPGDYTLDFSVSNNLLAWPGQELYFFGVYLSARDITGSPTGYDPNYHLVWDTFLAPYYQFNNNWLDATYANPIPNSDLFPGDTVSGFDVHITDSVAPTSVPWFAYTFDLNAVHNSSLNYNGGDNSINEGIATYNPGFEGTASPTTASVPEPTSFALFSMGLIGLVGSEWWKRRKKTAY
jgi:hypothetical protein